MVVVRSGVSTNFLWKIPPKGNLVLRQEEEIKAVVIIHEITDINQEMHYGHATCKRDGAKSVVGRYISSQWSSVTAISLSHNRSTISYQVTMRDHVNTQRWVQLPMHSNKYGSV